ncbi:alkaline phosphatase [Dyadobacter psychrotolerans]|uniref:Alkaline phosphatase n=1 Tax=Dyadobacter psychrotolerans TaxID=2541721 RepID=A0A4R5DS50_9BACT|nr:alkaline phosphatase [Dyadobacter psychrotolerans]TDE17159.1 alkaline phosphatase [Dyadobacter psychrotolerans]
MKRRDFFTSGSLALLGTSLINPLSVTANNLQSRKEKTAKNIIFMVSDGMSTGTLNMASLLSQRRNGRQSNWIKLYRENMGRRALMDTSSSNALVTDSAAGSSAWGGGVKVPNGSLNVNADGSFNKPILQKFKQAGKSVGCVTTVSITHATPAGFCVNNKSRGDEYEIAGQYLDLKFDVMMGGGSKFFSKETRKDKVDLLEKYNTAGYTLVANRDEMNALSARTDKPVLGLYAQNGLPYTLDSMHDEALQKSVPTLAEMTQKTIEILSRNSKGFVMQVEGGKVDWAAHANDSAGLLYDQIAFDDAIKVALEFAANDKETLVIMTTDHGNGNPGLFGSDKDFDRIQHFKHTNDWILNGITNKFTTAQVIERIEAAQGYAIKAAEAQTLLSAYTKMDGDGLYNPYKLPFQQLAQIQSSYISVNWASMGHSGDFVELAAFGPGSELLMPFVKNTDLHELMLQASGVKSV